MRGIKDKLLTFCMLRAWMGAARARKPPEVESEASACTIGATAIRQDRAE